MLLIGAAAGAAMLNAVTPVYVDALLAFGVAALLYLVTEEPLVEVHEETALPRTDRDVLPRFHSAFYGRHAGRRLPPAQEVSYAVSLARSSYRFF